MTLQCMRLVDHVTLNFNNKMSTADTWHYGLLCELSKLEFSTSVIKLIRSFLMEQKFRVLVEGEMSTARYMQAGVRQSSVLSPTLYSLYINDTPQTHGVHLAVFAGDTCLYATERKEGYVMRKRQRGHKLNGDLV
jgi:hypothetical protein